MNQFNCFYFYLMVLLQLVSKSFTLRRVPTICLTSDQQHKGCLFLFSSSLGKIPFHSKHFPSCTSSQSCVPCQLAFSDGWHISQHLKFRTLKIHNKSKNTLFKQMTDYTVIEEVQQCLYAGIFLPCWLSLSVKPTVF